MREFSLKETKFIVENQDSLSLGTMAKRLKCDWHEVYAHYDQVTKTKSYRKFMDKRREYNLDGSNWKKARFTYEEEDGNRKKPSNELYNPPSDDMPRHLTDSVYYQDYREWKRSQNSVGHSDVCVRKPSDVFSERIFHRED